MTKKELVDGIFDITQKYKDKLNCQLYVALMPNGELRHYLESFQEVLNYLQDRLQPKEMRIIASEAYTPADILPLKNNLAIWRFQITAMMNSSDEENRKTESLYFHRPVQVIWEGRRSWSLCCVKYQCCSSVSGIRRNHSRRKLQ